MEDPNRNNNSASTTDNGIPSIENSSSKKRSSCPYLDTINRRVLDFDFEQSCSVTLLSGPHIYGCLVCGKFFNGRGKHTPAFTHSVDEIHCVFIHLRSGKFYCLPDNYEIVDNPSLDDIRQALHPQQFTAEFIQSGTLDANTELARDLWGRQYLPGFVGLNNLHKTDYVNATLQALAHVRPIRDFFLQVSSSTNSNSHLACSFGDFMRKLWSNQRFKSNVDPHEMIQAISVASKKKFHAGTQAAASEFLPWFLHQLHIGVGGTSKKSSIVHDTFQGILEVTTRQAKKLTRKLKDTTDDEGSDAEESSPKPPYDNMSSKVEFVLEESTKTIPFLHLTLDIPEKPLFKDEDGGLVIPQEPLVTVLQKFDGVTFCDSKKPQQRCRYRLKQMPDYLILDLARFKKNDFYIEKNPTIVAFPIKNLDLTSYVHPIESKQITESEIKRMNVSELKKTLIKYGYKDVANNSLEKSELVNACLKYISNPIIDRQIYDLVANICHEIPAEVGREGQRNPLQDGSYKCHVQHKGSGQWYEIQDLHVQETMPQLIGLSESYILIFEKKKKNA